MLEATSCVTWTLSEPQNETRQARLTCERQLSSTRPVFYFQWVATLHREIVVDSHQGKLTLSYNSTPLSLVSPPPE